MRGITKVIEIDRFSARLRGNSDRWIPWVPVCFGSGVGGYFWLSVEPPIWVAPVAAGALFILLFAFRQIATTFLGFGGFLFFALGICVAQWTTLSSGAPVLSKEIGPATLEGRVLKVENFENGIRVLLEKPRITGLAVHKTPDRVRIRIRGKSVQASAGTWIAVTAVLMPPPAPSAPGGFDFQRKLYFEGIGAIGYGMGQPRVIQTQKYSRYSFEIWISQLRSLVAEKIALKLPGQTGAIAVA